MKDLCPTAQDPSRVLLVGRPCWLGMISAAGFETELCSVYTPTPCGRHLKQGHVNQIIVKRKQALAGLSRGGLGP